MFSYLFDPEVGAERRQGYADSFLAWALARSPLQYLGRSARIKNPALVVSELVALQQDLREDPDSSSVNTVL